jgi:hypothetical protein
MKTTKIQNSKAYHTVLKCLGMKLYILMVADVYVYPRMFQCLKLLFDHMF